MRIAYAGAEGAFAHEACLAFAGAYQPVAVADFAAVVAVVERSEAERGMLPLRNSSAGPVPLVAELLGEARVKATAEHALPVRIHLLGLPGTRIEELEEVISHPMALRQCSGSVAELGIRTRPAPNTALAARTLRQSKAGVLASEAAAIAYGLQILKRDMQDDPANATTFVIIEPHSN